MQDLRDSEAQLRLSVHASNIGLWDWNIRDDRLYLSPEWKSQLGHRDDEIANHYREWESRLHPEDRERVLPKIRAYLANPGPSYEAEFRLRHKDGSYRWIFARAQVEHDPEGNPLRMLGCHIDITDRKRTEEELQRSFSRLRELSRRVAEAQEAERRNISRELHDRVGQNLSALNLSLNLVRAQLAPGAPPAITDRLQDAQHLVEASVQQVRDVMAYLRPPALDDYGLLAALRTHADALSGRLGVPVVVTGREPEPRLSTATETALFRIAQEALNNVSKHAHAANVQVRLATLNGVVEMSVTDDGVGFDTGASSSERPTWGLKTMRERAEAVGATLRIERAPSGGTRVVVEAERGEA
jgi:two-component system sensor histidine kinase UhpB